MTKENKYCDDYSKIWIITSNEKDFIPSFVSSKNASREAYPELNFQHEEKEFIIQFENLSDLVACRDNGKEYAVRMFDLNRSKFKKVTIKHQKYDDQSTTKKD